MIASSLALDEIAGAIQVRHQAAYSGYARMLSTHREYAGSAVVIGGS